MIKAQDVNAWQFANLERYAEWNIFPLDERVNAVFIGNSITEGWFNTMPDFFLSNHYYGRGIGGQTSAQVLLRFMNDVVSLYPRLVVIEIGINDIAENTGPYHKEFTLSNIAAMLHIAKSNNITVVLSSVLPASQIGWRPSVTNVAEKVMQLNEGIKKIAEVNNVPYLDYHTALKNKEGGLDKNLAEDGVHPTLACYQVMADMAQKLIQQLITK